MHQVVRRREGEHLAVVVHVRAGAGESSSASRANVSVEANSCGTSARGGSASLGLVADPGEQVGEEVIDGVRRVDGLVHGLAGEEVLDETVLLPRAVNSRVMPSAVPRLWCACSSRSSSFSATVVSSLAPSDLGGEDQRGELGLVLLPVAVDPAVALLDADQRPRQVVVDQVVALAVQVDALGGHVAGEQHAHRLVRQAEALDDLLLLLVGEARRA